MKICDFRTRFEQSVKLLRVPGRRRQVHEHERLRVTTERVAHELRELVVPVRHGLGVRRQGLGCERSVKIK